MKKSEIQGELWGKSPNGWAEVQEILHGPHLNRREETSWFEV